MLGMLGMLGMNKQKQGLLLVFESFVFLKKTCRLFLDQNFNSIKVVVNLDADFGADLESAEIGHGVISFKANGCGGVDVNSGSFAVSQFDINLFSVG